ncbi:MAG TPA: tetratricopeptide repeat protein [Longimicrobiales bacterium]|nr:tetratricopeptide repeat protein [Longimicrobiales bacterium]
MAWQSTDLSEAADAYEARDYQRVVQLLQHVPRSYLLATARYGFMLADSARRVGGIPDVLDLNTAVVEASRGLNSETFCDALNLQGVLLLESGDAEAARRTWFDLVDAATLADNPTHVARASNNLGVAAILALQLDEAITAFQRSVSAYLRSTYSRGLAQSHHNLGIVFRELDHTDEAHSHFQQAITFGYSADCVDDVARAEAEMALLYIYVEKNQQAAMAVARSALMRYTELGQPAGIANAMRVIGICSLSAGDIDGAEQSLHAALAMGSYRNLPLLEAETLLALAAHARRKARALHALQLEQQAKDIFASIYATPWGEQVGKRMAAL